MEKIPFTVRLFHWHDSLGYISLILSLYFYERAKPEAINMFNVWVSKSSLRSYDLGYLSASRTFAFAGTLLCLISILLNLLNKNMYHANISITAIIGAIGGVLLILLTL